MSTDVPDRELIWSIRRLYANMFPNGNTMESKMGQMGEKEAEEFGRLIRQRRKALGMRQEDVVFATGVGRRFLIELEAGKPTARLGPALMIARQLGIVPALEEGVMPSSSPSLPPVRE